MQLRHIPFSPNRVAIHRLSDDRQSHWRPDYFRPYLRPNHFVSNLGKGDLILALTQLSILTLT